MKVVLTINEFGIHLSQAGKPGSSYDAGENGEDLGLAMLDAGKELLGRYRVQQAAQKNKEALDGFLAKNI